MMRSVSPEVKARDPRSSGLKLSGTLWVGFFSGESRYAAAVAGLGHLLDYRAEPAAAQARPW
jgi:hypothetical protein